MIYDDEIADILSRYPDPQTCADKLVDAALDAGGHDNVTAIVIDITSSENGKASLIKKARRRYRGLITFAAIAIVALFALSIFAGYQYVNNSAYLIEENGHVSVYRGIQDSVFGISLSSLEEETDISVDDLNPGVANRLKEGLAVASMEEANDLLESYRNDIIKEQIAEAEAKSANASGSNSESSGSSSDSAASKSGATSKTAKGTDAP